MWPIMRRGLSTVTPFTYRDGATYLELLELIKQAVKELVGWSGEVKDELDAMEEHIKQIEIASANSIRLGLAEIRAENAKFRAEVLNLIAEATTSGSAFNPTNGKVEPVSKVMVDVYDNVRVFAWFVDDIDAMDITVEDFEALDLSVEHFDLGATYPVINDELKV